MQSHETIVTPETRVSDSGAGVGELVNEQPPAVQQQQEELIALASSSNKKLNIKPPKPKSFLPRWALKILIQL